MGGGGSLMGIFLGGGNKQIFGWWWGGLPLIHPLAPSRKNQLSKCDQASDFGNNMIWPLNLSLIYKTLWTGAGSGLLISMLGKLNRFHLTSLITLVLLMSKWLGLLLRKMLWLTFYSKLD